MNLNDNRSAVRHKFDNLKIGLSRSRSLFVKEMELRNSQAVNFSNFGFQVVSNLVVTKDDAYDFSFSLPIYGVVNGRAKVQWKERVVDNQYLSYVGLKIVRLKSSGKKIVSEITYSPMLMSKLNEMMHSQVKAQTISKRWKI